MIGIDKPMCSNKWFRHEFGE